MRAPVDPAFVEWKSLIIRTIHAGLLAQMDQLEEIINPINEEHTLIAYGQMFIVTHGARALMDPVIGTRLNLSREVCGTLCSQKTQMNVYSTYGLTMV